MDNYSFQGGNANWQAPYARPTYGGWPNQAPYPAQQAQIQLTTNVELVMSLEEALFKSNARNSDMLYLDQNKPVLYRIKVDMSGVKSYAILPYTLPDQVDNAPATKADIQALAAALSEMASRFDALEKSKEGKIPPKKRKIEEVEDVESNG